MLGWEGVESSNGGLLTRQLLREARKKRAMEVTAVPGVVRMDGWSKWWDFPKAPFRIQDQLMVSFDAKTEIIGKRMERLMDGWMPRARTAGARGETGTTHEVEREA
jgi:hypothetical protein